MSTHVLVAGFSTRAIADSAARAGFPVTAIDGFADLDQHPSVRVHAIRRGASVNTRALAQFGRSIVCDAVAYTSSFENDPESVQRLAEGRRLWGNPPRTLRRVRDARLLADACNRHGHSVPAVRLGPIPLSGYDRRRRWIAKPVASGGGHDVRLWKHAFVPRGCYLQEVVEGIAGSIVFVAAAGVAVPLGVSRQLFGDPAFGAVKYQYCGSILAPAADACFDDDARLVERAAALTRLVAEEFDVVGVNGVDFVARGGIPYPVEVNPRWSASMDLVERQYNLSVFGVHAAACQGQHLPEFDLRCERSRPGAIGKAIIYARHDAIVGDTSAWLSNAEIRDVPRTGEYIRATRPVCTVYARDRDAVRCYAELVARAESVYSRLALWRTPVRPV